MDNVKENSVIENSSLYKCYATNTHTKYIKHLEIMTLRYRINKSNHKNIIK